MYGFRVAHPVDVDEIKLFFSRKGLPEEFVSRICDQTAKLRAEHPKKYFKTAEKFFYDG